MNCWEFKGCGREPGGSRVAELGVCPAAQFEPGDGFLGGTKGGRACAFVAGTFCDGSVQGTYRDKSKTCWDCDFYRMLRHENGAAFSMPAFGLYVRERDVAAFQSFLVENHRTSSE